MPLFKPHVVHFWKLWRSPVWREAEKAVKEVSKRGFVKRVASNEPYTSFCPTCGQLPTGDRRTAEARELVVAKGYKPGSDLNFALEWHWFWLKFWRSQ